MNHEAVYRTAPATPGLLNIYLTKWIFGGPLNVQEWLKLYFHLETCPLRIQEYSIDDNFVNVVHCILHCIVYCKFYEVEVNILVIVFIAVLSH